MCDTYERQRSETMANKYIPLKIKKGPVKNVERVRK